MKFSLIASVALLVGVVFAEGQLEDRAVSKKCRKILKKIPACAVPCIQAAAKANGCKPKNYQCICSKEMAIEQSAEACVLANCTTAEAETALTESEAFCTCLEGM